MKCGRKRKLDCKILQSIVESKINLQWSPEEIDFRLRRERRQTVVSYNTIYRSIYREEFNVGNRLGSRKLRGKGMKRKTKDHVETRGKISISHTIHNRPVEANERLELGHIEVDTVEGSKGKACVVTLADRVSRYLWIGKVDAKKTQFVIDKMIELLSPLGEEYCKTVTADRGKEFSHHQRLTDALDGVPVYFADPHSPWQRGTNENTNGLLREYMPKGFDITDTSESTIQTWANLLNHRPRKCLNWRTPYEVMFEQEVSLIENNLEAPSV